MSERMAAVRGYRPFLTWLIGTSLSAAYSRGMPSIRSLMMFRGEFTNPARDAHLVFHSSPPSGAVRQVRI